MDCRHYECECPAPPVDELSGLVIYYALPLKFLRSKITSSLSHLHITINPNEMNWCGYCGRGSIHGEEFDFSVNIYAKDTIHIIELQCLNPSEAYSEFVEQFLKINRFTIVSGKLDISPRNSQGNYGNANYYHSFVKLLQTEHRLTEILWCKYLIVNPPYHDEVVCEYIIRPLLVLLKEKLETNILVAILGVIRSLASSVKSDYILPECARALFPLERNYNTYEIHVRNEINLCVRELNKRLN